MTGQQPVEPDGQDQSEQHAADGALEGTNIHQQQAAAFIKIADGYGRMAETLARAFGEARPVFAEPATEEVYDAVVSSVPRQAKAIAERMRLTGQAAAAMSFAHEELMASGGPGNPEALARYQEASEWYGDLISAERPDGDASPLS